MFTSQTHRLVNIASEYLDISIFFRLRRRAFFNSLPPASEMNLGGGHFVPNCLLAPLSSALKSCSSPRVPTSFSLKVEVNFRVGTFRTQYVFKGGHFVPNTRKYGGSIHLKKGGHFVPNRGDISYPIGGTFRTQYLQKKRLKNAP